LSVVDGVQLVETLHSCGINVRSDLSNLTLIDSRSYLGAIAAAASAPHVATLCLTELLARGFKHVLRAFLRSCPTAQLVPPPLPLSRAQAEAVASALNCLFGRVDEVPPPSPLKLTHFSEVEKSAPQGQEAPRPPRRWSRPPPSTP
jgi:hypothetical protein